MGATGEVAGTDDEGAVVGVTGTTVVEATTLVVLRLVEVPLEMVETEVAKIVDVVNCEVLLTGRVVVALVKTEEVLLTGRVVVALVRTEVVLLQGVVVVERGVPLEEEALLEEEVLLEEVTGDLMLLEVELHEVSVG